MVPAAPPTLASVSRSTKSKPVAVAAARTYRVKPGDTLSGIARQFDLTVTSLKQINKLTSDQIAVGDTLNLRR
jgi:LysM repeat protein